MPAVEDLVHGDEVITGDGIRLENPCRLGNERLILRDGDLRRLLAHLRSEFKLSAALERAEATAEMELNAVVAAEAGLDVGPPQGVTATGALAPAHLCP